MFMKVSFSGKSLFEIEPVKQFENIKNPLSTHHTLKHIPP